MLDRDTSEHLATRSTTAGSEQLITVDAVAVVSAIGDGP